MITGPQNGTRTIRASLLDFRVGARMLVRYPGLTIVGTLAMSVAIAVGTIYYEAVHSWQHPRLPVREAERVVSIRNWDTRAAVVESRSLHDFAAWRAQVRTIDHLGAAVPFVRNVATADGTVEPARGAEISASAFRLHETPPLLGRFLLPSDESPGAPLVAVIGHALWSGRFESDPRVLGTTIRVGSVHATIVGVMPPGFAFPVSQRIWLPLRTDGATVAPRGGPSVSVFGRLAPGATLDMAQAELAIVGARVAGTTPATHEHLRPRVSRYMEPLAGGQEAATIRTLMIVVNGIVLMLMTILCANVATLVFARTATRGWEITVRSALGASRGRIVMQLFVEALVLAAVAAVLGVAVARGVLRWGVGLLEAGGAMPYWIDDGLALTTVLYTSLLTLFGAAIIGVLPALRVTRLDVQQALRSEGAARAGLRFGGFWTTVIVVQVAITVAFLPLAAGGIFESNRFNLRAQGIGADGYLTASVEVDREDHAMDSTAHATLTRLRLQELERRLLAEPGVERVAYADRLPVMDQFKYSIEVDSSSGPVAGDLRTAPVAQVSAGYFRAFGTSLVSGRDFLPRDFEDGRVLIVNESFVRHVLGDRNAIGQRIRIRDGEDSRLVSRDWYEIVGVVRDFGWRPPERHEQAGMYRPRPAIPDQEVNLAVRVSDPEEFAPRLRTIAGEVDPAIRLSEVQPLTKVGGGEAKANWVLTGVAWLLGGIVLLLSATGIHALMSFTVARRTREIGIRAALGASPARLVAGIFSRATLQVGAGVLAGSALAALIGLGSTRQLLLLLAADGIMLAVGMAACYVPLRRALRIHPTDALRAEG